MFQQGVSGSRLQGFSFVRSALFAWALLAGFLPSSSLLAQQKPDFNKIPDGEVPLASARTPITLHQTGTDTDLAQCAKSFQQLLLSEHYEGQGWAYIGSDPGDPGAGHHGANPAQPKQALMIDGFSVVTQIEQYEKDGSSMKGAKRWEISNSSDNDTIMDQIKKVLLGAPVGHYRMFLFIVTYDERSPQKQNTQATYVEWSKYFNQLYRTPMLAEFANVSMIGRKLNGMAFVYEFDRASTDGELAFHDKPTLSAQDHLKGAGLWANLDPSQQSN